MKKIFKKVKEKKALQSRFSIFFLPSSHHFEKFIMFAVAPGLTWFFFTIIIIKKNTVCLSLPFQQRCYYFKKKGETENKSRKKERIEKTSRWWWCKYMTCFYGADYFKMKKTPFFPFPVLFVLKMMFITTTIYSGDYEEKYCGLMLSVWWIIIRSFNDNKLANDNHKFKCVFQHILKRLQNISYHNPVSLHNSHYMHMCAIQYGALLLSKRKLWFYSLSWQRKHWNVPN